MDIVTSCLIIGITLYSMWGGLKDIVSGASSPDLLTWLIRAILCALLFCALVYEGATYASLALWFSQLICCVGIVALTIKKHGPLGKISWIDGICIVFASAGVFAWAISSDPVYGVVGVILAELVATAMGVRAAFIKRRLESFQFWILALCAAVLSLMMVDTLTLALVLAPAFSVGNAVVNIATVWWIARQELPPRQAMQET